MSDYKTQQLKAAKQRQHGSSPGSQPWQVQLDAIPTCSPWVLERLALPVSGPSITARVFLTVDPFPYFRKRSCASVCCLFCPEESELLKITVLKKCGNKLFLFPASSPQQKKIVLVRCQAMLFMHVHIWERRVPSVTA